MSHVTIEEAGAPGRSPLARFIPDASTLRDLCLGGAAGLLTWEVFARVITP